MAYSWDNRVKFVVRYMYDIDNNGFLDKNDFECLAVRNTVIEGKGDWNEATFKKNQEVMANLWNEIAELADFNKVLLVFYTHPGFLQKKYPLARLWTISPIGIMPYRVSQLGNIFKLRLGAVQSLLGHPVLLGIRS